MELENRVIFSPRFWLFSCFPLFFFSSCFLLFFYGSFFLCFPWDSNSIGLSPILAVSFFFYPPRFYLSHLSLWWLLLPICYLLPSYSSTSPTPCPSGSRHLAHLSIKAYLSGREEGRVMAPFTC